MLLAWGRVLLVFKVRVFHLKLGSHAGLVSWWVSRWRKLMGVRSCPQKFEQTCQFDLNNCLLDHLLSGPTKTPFYSPLIVKRHRQRFIKATVHYPEAPWIRHFVAYLEWDLQGKECQLPRTVPSLSYDLFGINIQIIKPKLTEILVEFCYTIILTPLR